MTVREACYGLDASKAFPLSGGGVLLVSRPVRGETVTERRARQAKNLEWIAWVASYTARRKETS